MSDDMDKYLTPGIETLIDNLRNEEYGNDIQKKYRNLIDNDEMNAFINLRNKSGIEPSDETIQHSYSHYLKQGDVNHCSYVYDMFEIKPSKEFIEKNYELIQKNYTDTLNNKDQSLGDLGKLYELTKVKPKVSEDIVQKKYECLVQSEFVFLDRIKILKELTGIKPNLSDVDVRRAFDTWINRPSRI